MIIPTGPLQTNTLQVAAQSVTMPGTEKVIAPPANPVMERRVHPLPPATPQINREESVELSDPHADKIDLEHINAVQSSADALGL